MYGEINQLYQSKYQSNFTLFLGEPTLNSLKYYDVNNWYGKVWDKCKSIWLFEVLLMCIFYT